MTDTTSDPAALAERLDEIARTVQMTLVQSDDVVRAAAVLRSQGERALKLAVPHYPDGDASQHSVSSKPAALDASLTLADRLTNALNHGVHVTDVELAGLVREAVSEIWRLWRELDAAELRAERAELVAALKGDTNGRHATT